ncbi:hypothetical protein CEXT_21341 [Caerostris extrusa]|uniref:Uncharacterized protein n=1 Tax=Caerostris extrusa TaxID=172846 RepID=A0AAV4Q9T8_CAEEX|nr:hypothetical protein CEXT_21341 [Caerostris extrusa]
MLAYKAEHVPSAFSIKSSEVLQRGEPGSDPIYHAPPYQSCSTAKIEPIGLECIRKQDRGNAHGRSER